MKPRRRFRITPLTRVSFALSASSIQGDNPPSLSRVIVASSLLFVNEESWYDDVPDRSMPDDGGRLPHRILIMSRDQTPYLLAYVPVIERRQHEASTSAIQDLALSAVGVRGRRDVQHELQAEDMQSNGVG